MRLAWLTDIHLECLDANAYSAFVEDVRQAHADALVISGDIGYSYTVGDYLVRLSEDLECQVYFVLGNHDYWGGEIAETRESIRALCHDHERLTWLTDSAPVKLTSQMGLIGHDCWADSRFGDYTKSTVMLNDYFLIRDFAEPSPDFIRAHESDAPSLIRANWPFSDEGKAARRELMLRLGDEAAAHFSTALPNALESYKQVIAVTHPPPFQEASWHMGKVSDGAGQAHFTCKAAGDALVDVMRQRPDRQLTVLCGHTHERAEAQILDNLVVLTGAARYTEPRIEKLFDLS